MSALEKCGKAAEITRFKGLGEISPGEFKHFITPEEYSPNSGKYRR